MGRRPQARPAACEVRRKDGAEDAGPSSQAQILCSAREELEGPRREAARVWAPGAPAEGAALIPGQPSARTAPSASEHPKLSHPQLHTFVPWTANNPNSIQSPEQAAGPPGRPAAGLGRAKVPAGAGRPFPCLPHSPLLSEEQMGLTSASAGFGVAVRLVQGTRAHHRPLPPPLRNCSPRTARRDVTRKTLF